MVLKSLKDIDIQGKIVLYRAPYDIEVIDGKLEDTKRIDFTIPTLNYLLAKHCKVVIVTYVGRPDGKVVESLKTTFHAKYLSDKLNINIKKLDDCIGKEVTNAVEQMKAGEVLMLENVRFYKEEVEDDDDFAIKLCGWADIIVFDAFPQAHRKHASTTGILRHKESVVGFYFEKEYNQIEKIISEIRRPFVSVIGGAKVSDKVLAIKKLAKISDLVLVGGGVANAFLYQQGVNTSDSFVENVEVNQASVEQKDIKSLVLDILSDKKSVNIVIPDGVVGIENSNIILPVDFVVEVNNKPVNMQISELKDKTNFKIKDVGSNTNKVFTDILTIANTIFWFGPMGVFEQDEYSAGSKSVMHFMKNFRGLGLIAGGDSIALIDKFDNISNFEFISLAGGATLDIISGKELVVMPYLTK